MNNNFVTKYKILFDDVCIRLKNTWRNPFPYLYTYFNFVLENYDQMENYLNHNKTLEKNLHVIKSLSTAYAGRSWLDYSRQLDVVLTYITAVQVRAKI